MGDKKRGPTILCTWEIGAELGHISKLCSIAKTLESQNFEVVVALKDLSRAYPFFANTRARILQAPVWLPQIKMQRPIACLADTLLLLGYLETDPLHMLVKAWQSLIDSVKPDLVIFDYSPTAMLALHGNPIPKILVSSGFADPVPGRPIADWRPYPTKDELINRQETRVLQQINAVLARQKKAPIKFLGDLFSTNKVLVNSLIELDVYGTLRPNAEYCLESTNAVIAPPVCFGENIRPRILAYLKPAYPQFKLLVAALAQCQANVFIACPNGPAEELEQYASEDFQYSVGLVDLQKAALDADLFVGHGNATSSLENLVAGKPVVVLPIQLEQLLIGKKIQSLGLGLLVEQIKTVEDLTALFDNALQNIAQYSKNIAQLLKRYPQPHVSVADAAAAACTDLLQGESTVI